MHKYGVTKQILGVSFLIVIAIGLYGCVNTDNESPQKQPSPVETATITDRANNNDAENGNLRRKLEMQTWYLTELTNVNNFHYEVISCPQKEQKEMIVFFDQVPDGDEQKKILLLRSAIEFSYYQDGTVSLWEDKNNAIKYCNDDFNPEEGFLGWKGYDSRFGSIVNNDQEHRLTFYLSRDDQEAVDFGKYTSPE